jgi:hypothetical protein
MDAHSLEPTRKAFLRRNADYDNPGPTKMWFGMFKGKRLDELDAEYKKKLLKTNPWPNLKTKVCHSTSVLEYEMTTQPANRAQFDDFKVINNRFNEKMEEARNTPATAAATDASHELEEAEDMQETEEGDGMSRLSRPRTSRSAPNIVNPMGRLLGPWDDLLPSPNEPIHTGQGDILESWTNLPALSPRGYFKTAKSTLSRNNQGNSNAPQASRSILVDTNTPTGHRSLPQIPLSDGNDAENPNILPDPSQHLFSSWASDAPKAVLEASKKRKCDSMMNLSSSASRSASAKRGPTVLAGSKPKRRNSAKESSPSLRRRTERRPLASLSQNGQQTSSFLEEGSPGTIVVQAPDLNDGLVANPASKSKKKKLTQAPKEIKAFVSW